MSEWAPSTGIIIWHMYVGFVAVSGYNAGKFVKQMNLLEIIKTSDEHSLERTQEFRSCRDWGCEIVVEIPHLHIWNRITFVNHPHSIDFCNDDEVFLCKKFLRMSTLIYVNLILNEKNRNYSSYYK